MISRICDYGTVLFIGLLIGIVIGMVGIEQMSIKPFEVVMTDGTKYKADSLTMPISNSDGTAVELLLPNHQKVYVPQQLIKAVIKR